MAANQETVRFWEGVWNAMLERLQRPVNGVLLAQGLARRLGEPLLLQLVRQHDEENEEAETSAEALREAGTTSKEYVAEERKLSGDQERHRDSEDDRYERNLNLPALQERRSDGVFGHQEWGALDRFLRPFGFQVLKSKGLQEEDNEEVFNDAFASLALVKGEATNAPIEELLVFEEVIPNFCRRVGFRAIDVLRRKSAQKARPEHLQSLEGSADEEEGTAMQVADRAVADPERPESWRFEEIYRQCREELTPSQWGLIYDLYVAQKYTVKDLVADEEKLTFLGVDLDQSASTLRRRVDEILQPALEKLADALRL